MNDETDSLNMDLTAQEQAEVDADKAQQAGAAAAQDDAAPEAMDADEQPNAQPSASDASAQALAEAAAALRQTAESLRARNEAPPEREQEAAPPPPPDFDAERKALREKYDAGELDDAEYEREREAIMERKAEFVAEQKAAALVAKAAAESAQRAAADADQRWNESLSRFIAGDKANLTTDPIRKAAFEQALAKVAAEKPGSSYDDWLTEASATTMRAFGIAAPADAGKKAVANAIAERSSQRQHSAPDLSRVPSAGAPAIGGFGAELDSLDINSLEDRLARMNDAQIAAFLADAPGGLRDNPRFAES